MESLIQDLRSALRTMGKKRRLTAVVVLSAGLAIGANTAVFSVVNAFLLRPWAIEDVDRVVRVREDYATPGHQPDVRGFSASNLGRWQRENTVFAGMAAGTGDSLTLTDKDGAESISAALVSWNFFPVLGIKPVLGRSFTPEEDQPGRDDTVILGYGIWRSRFGGDPQVLGKTLILNNRPHTVIGVMPRGLRHPYQAEMWVLLGYREDPTSTAEYYVPARLKPGVTVERANAEMDAMAQRIHQENPGPNVPTGANVNLLRPEMIGELNRVLYLLSAAALFVLLIACANISNLLLAQSLNQGFEVAVRAALGATRGRLIRQFLTYSVLLSVVGGLVGVLLTFWSVKPLVALSPLYGAGEFDIEPRLDLPTLGFTFLISLAVGVVFGLIPALKMSKVGLESSLRQGGRSRLMSAGTRRLLGAFVMAEVALALILLVGAGLGFRSLEKMRNEDRGFDRQDVLSFATSFPDFNYPERGQKVAFIREAVRRLRDIPGVEAVGGTTTQPFYAGTSTASFNVEGKPAANERGFHVTHSKTITPGYLEAMKIPLIAGRHFTEDDIERAPLVVLVTKSFADRYWPGENAVGKRVKRDVYGSERPWLTVVGVVGTIKENEDPGMPSSDAWYLPYAQPIIPDLDSMVFMIKSRSGPSSLMPAVRAAISGIKRDQPIYSALTMEERFAYRTQTQRGSSRLYGSIGFLGLFLAAIGIYSVLAFYVSQRMPEIGIRSALGALPGEVRLLILRKAMTLAAGGLAFGLGGALMLTRFLTTELYQVDPHDPLTLAGAFLCVAVTALIASVIPANRAAKVSPLSALRYE